MGCSTEPLNSDYDQRPLVEDVVHRLDIFKLVWNFLQMTDEINGSDFHTCKEKICLDVVLTILVLSLMSLACLSVCLPAHLPACQPACLSVCVTVCLRWLVHLLPELMHCTKQQKGEQGFCNEYNF